MESALRDLAQRWRRYWPSSDIDAITRDVEQRFAAACAHWSLADPVPLPGGAVALTCAAGEAVVKVLPRGHPEAATMRGEGEALALWSATGAAVELIDRRDGGMTLLMPRVRPATTLDEAVSDYHAQLVVTGRLVRRLHAVGEPPPALPGIELYVEPYRRVVGDELDRLVEPSVAPVAVHGDLHGGNVLLDDQRWVAIDPKGVRGDRHLDIWLLVCPQAPPLPAEPLAARAEMWRRVNLYAQAAALDPERAAAWARVVASAESVLSADSVCEGWPMRLRRIAAALAAPR
jgi:streptomycin 6-kinase